MPIRNPRRILVCTLLAALPVGVELPAAERTGELEVALHGGGGQAVTVIRDCSGNALRSDDRPFASARSRARTSARRSTRVRR